MMFFIVVEFTALIIVLGIVMLNNTKLDDIREDLKKLQERLNVK